MGNYKKCYIMETAGRRVKRTKIWDSGTLVTHMWCTFDLVVVTADILAHQVLLNRVPEQATEDRVRYQIYY